jgi:hypothetical protein
MILERPSASQSGTVESCKKVVVMVGEAAGRRVGEGASYVSDGTPKKVVGVGRMADWGGERYGHRKTSFLASEANEAERRGAWVDGSEEKLWRVRTPPGIAAAHMVNARGLNGLKDFL